MPEIDWVLGTAVGLDVILLLMMVGLRRAMGNKEFMSALKVAAFRFRHPIRQIKLFKGQFLEIEYRDMETATQFDHQTNNAPISINESARYNSEGMCKSYFFAEGSTENFDPMRINQKFYELLKRIGLQNDKYLDYKEQRIRAKWNDQILTKEHFNKISLVIIAGVGVTLYFMYNIHQFTDSAQATYNQWAPILQQQFKNVPALIPQPSTLDPQTILKQINGGK